MRRRRGLGRKPLNQFTNPRELFWCSRSSSPLQRRTSQHLCARLPSLALSPCRTASLHAPTPASSSTMTASPSPYVPLHTQPFRVFISFSCFRVSCVLSLVLPLHWNFIFSALELPSVLLSFIGGRTLSQSYFVCMRYVRYCNLSYSSFARGFCFCSAIS